jgi:3-dehydroquinate dehydratase
MTFEEQLEQLQISIDNFKISVEKYLKSIKQKEGEKVPYKITIKDQKTGEEIKKEIQTLKELKWLLLEYKDQLIDFEMKGENNDIYKTNKTR